MILEVCVVSPSPALAMELEGLLIDDKISIEHASSGRVALKRADCGCSSAILLDEDPPDMTTAELLRNLSNGQGRSNALVVVLSERASEIDRVIAFELGADDFIAKPIGPRELALRLRAVLRRHEDDQQRIPIMEIGPFVIDTVEEKVTCNGELVRLTSVEFRLLEHLARNSGQVQDRRELLARVWKWCEPTNDRPTVSRTVDTHVKRLREKLGPASELIETIRGVGYRLRLAG
jgi:two-component system phosphate regulon response regulator PhoB